ncbi:oxidoreductase [Penicillium riverlandense]|uniref:oxidoreductase n=1 Tax=Penicillium riverlandense TaxID=1903569 RepID=UPI0025474502|nr:oxidoreductase [Penicillium riverlandense]KAJ5819747.1 oxidoreductase [Penicillium riverlandense]
MPWHSGERKMHDLMKVSDQVNPTSELLPPGTGHFVYQAPLVAIGVVDHWGKPWTTVLGGEPGFARPVGDSMIMMDTPAPNMDDPILQFLLGSTPVNQTAQFHGEKPIIAGLAIDLESRMRVKLHGRFRAGQVYYEGQTRRAQLVFEIDASLPNCPKYLNEKFIIPNLSDPKTLPDSPKLSPQAVDLLKKADLFFISSSNAGVDMDTNHRGGPPGFVRVVSNNPSGAVLIYPEYSGNRLYQTLGNIQTTPFAGLTVPDFDTGDVLYLTGEAQVLSGERAADILPRSKIAVKITVLSSRFVLQGLPFLGKPGSFSPYNPPIRFASGEKELGKPVDTTMATALNRAVLTGFQRLTPTIARFHFRVEGKSTLKAWNPGQYATLSFAEDLDQGWSHMRDEDPRSLNDDYIRTFTISSSPKSPADGPLEFELTIRNVGRATNYLFHQEANGAYSLPLLGFGGNFHFEDKRRPIVFIASGIGITPLLGQVSSLEKTQVSNLQILWSIRVNDVELALDTLSKNPELIPSTKLFLTGNVSKLERNDGEAALLKKLIDADVSITRRRFQEQDIVELRSEVETDWYMCVGSELKGLVLQWLAGRKVEYEDFGY